MLKRPAMRYHGGKFRLAPWVISHFPDHKIYIEPYGGAASVLLMKPRSYSEVYNDLDDQMVNFFQVCRDPALRERLIEACAMTPFARKEFVQAYERSDDPVEAARRLVVRSEMGFGSTGASKPRTGFRIDTRREYGTAASAWERFPENIANVGRRMTGVVIESRPALQVIQDQDGDDDVLFYLDPPYPMGTRAVHKNSDRVYRYEMSDDDHAELLEVVKGLRGMCVLSSYPNEMYSAVLAPAGWRLVTGSARIAGQKGTTLREEALWINPAAQDAGIKQKGMFA